MNIHQLLDKMWNDYVGLNPGAAKIVELFEKEGNEVVNDHIALRTFNHPRVCVDVIAKPFIEAGYYENGTYNFEEKKLFAKHYEHKDENMPKIFISELLTGEFSPFLNEKVNAIVDSLTDEQIASFDFCSTGRSWDFTFEDYNKLKDESEYAAWLSAIGYRPNHFTVFVNKLKTFNDLENLNKFLKENGFKLNDSGGEIKGSKEVYLEQSSTKADSIDITFSDTTANIASCYFEFAKRYPLSNGELYQGFVAKSADKIFESTTL
ncbi:MAG: DUF1338 domain-containing protein [Bacteriovoracaceae bacterium]|nr:DUF1338 domain-containing protein [Bacteriovoracaceae bacterium]